MALTAAGPARTLKIALFLGVALLAALPAAAGGRNLYVANAGSDSVSVIDTGTNSVVGTVNLPSGTNPTCVAITPDGTRAYVPNSHDLSGTPGMHNVTVIDLASNTVVAEIPSGTKPRCAAVTPDGSRVYVTAQDSNAIVVIDAATNSVVKTITSGVGNSPQVIAITPDGSKAFFTNGANGGGNEVHVLNTTNDTASGTINLGGCSPPGDPCVTEFLQITPDGQRGYVVRRDGNEVSVIDAVAGTEAPVPVIGLGAGGATPKAEGITISPDGSRAYVARDGTADDVKVIDTTLSPPQVVDTIAGLGDNPFYASISPDGSRAYVNVQESGPGADKVAIVDLGTNTVTGTIDIGVGPVGSAIVPAVGAVADFTATPAPPGSPTTFSAASAENLSGTAARYDWNFGDGTAAANAGRGPSHTYASPGTYDVTLTVTADMGSVSGGIFTGQTAYVRNGAPTSAAKTVTVSVLTASGDTTGPIVTVKSPKQNQKIKRRKFKKARGTASDASGVSSVEYAIRTKLSTTKARSAKGKTSKCKFVKKSGKLSSRKSCTRISYLSAKGTTSWSAKLKKQLPQGRYTLYARASDSRGNSSEPVSVRFRIT